MTTTETDRDFVGDYRPAAGSFDEMVDSNGALRGHWESLTTSLAGLGANELARCRTEARRLLDDDGVTYHPTADAHADTTAPGADRWNLDPLPVVVSHDEWQGLETSIEQRAELLNLVLADLYGKRTLVTKGLVPPEVVYAHSGFVRECDGIELPGAHQLFLASTDLARDADGRRVALSDRTQAPSGAGYALENRTVVSRVFPDVYRNSGVQRLAPFFRELRTSLRQIAPPSAEAPRIVVLTPGPRSETAFEHALLAANLGCALVKGTDLRVRDGRVWMRTLGRLAPVHVILRRVDAEYCDPLELRPDSHLGVPGLLEACRLGNVSVVNTLGSGILENPALLPFLPALAEALLGESLRLPSVDTWWCGEPSSLSHVLAHLDELVIKPVVRGQSVATVLGWELDASERDDLVSRLRAEPTAWVGQDRLAISSVPTLVDGGVEARRAVLRTFAVATADGYRVMPGGLTRVAADVSSTLITNQTGALSKDTWVLSDEPELLTGFWLQSSPSTEGLLPEASTSSRAAENLFWLSRYAERAEHLVRLLRVVSDRRNEFASGTNPAGNASLHVLLAALTHGTGTFPGFVGDDGARARSAPGTELRSLVCDADRTGTLAFNVARLLEAAAEVRDQLSNDTWLVIGHLDRDISGLDTRFGSGAAQTALGRVMQGMLALAGLSAESMVRDPGWQFMEIGRRIERALQLCSLLDATVVASIDTATDSFVLESTLMAAESIITYRRRYRGRARIDTVLDLLIGDADNPRSLLYQVSALADHVAHLPTDPDADAGGNADAETPPAIGHATAALRRVASADTAALATIGPDGLRVALRAFLAEVVAELAATAAAIENTHFTRQLPQLTVFTLNDPGRR